MEEGLLQINKELGFIVYSWLKEAGLATLDRSSLCREQSSGHKHHKHGEGGSYVFYIHYQHPCLDQRKKVLLSLWVSSGCGDRSNHFPKDLSPWHGRAHVNSTYSLISLLPTGCAVKMPSKYLGLHPWFCSDCSGWWWSQRLKTGQSVENTTECSPLSMRHSYYLLQDSWGITGEGRERM